MKKTEPPLAIPISILISAVLIAVTIITTNRPNVPPTTSSRPVESFELPVRWGDLGRQMIAAGVIDAEKIDGETRNLLYGKNNGNLKITPENSGAILNILWALGLSTKNDILETGPMSDPRYGNAGVFASTGGWTLAVGNAMAHYSRHSFVTLTPVEQRLVERVSKNIYRPCCNNPTHFPDCNHGMAMLGLLELMASQGVSENEMYRVALQVNTYWFPDNYETIADYLARRGVPWDKADPKEILGYDYSSAAGYQKILSQLPPAQPKGGSSCAI